jgi:hypothetical protein
MRHPYFQSPREEQRDEARYVREREVNQFLASLKKRPPLTRVLHELPIDFRSATFSP